MAGEYLADEVGVSITQRWLDMLTPKIGKRVIELIDVTLDDGETYRLRPDEVMGSMWSDMTDVLERSLSTWTEPHRIDGH
jgi:hypothetical protein